MQPVKILGDPHVEEAGLAPGPVKSLSSNWSSKNMWTKEVEKSREKNPWCDGFCFGAMVTVPKLLLF